MEAAKRWARLAVLQASNHLHATLIAYTFGRPMALRNKILDAALRVFAETGYRGATTRRIAQEADVNEVTLFRQFGSKDELIREAVKYAALEEDACRLPEVPADPYRELTDWAREHLRRLRHRGPV